MAVRDCNANWNPAAEFKEFSRKQIQHYQKMFKHYDTNRDKYLDADELQKMLRKLGVTQAEGSDVQSMIDEVDEDKDGKMSFREFLLIFRRALNGNLRHVGLIEIHRQMHVVDADNEDAVPEISAFKAQIDEWSKTEEGTMI